MSTDETRINEQIRADRVRLIGSDGTQYGLKTVPDALQIAQEEGLDLVEVLVLADTLDEHGGDALRGDGFGTR